MVICKYNNFVCWVFFFNLLCNNSYNIICFSIITFNLINIILDDMLIPELLQYDLNSKKLIAETKRFFSDTNYKQKILTGYQKIKNKLGQPGASKRAADYIIKAT